MSCARKIVAKFDQFATASESSSGRKNWRKFSEIKVKWRVFFCCFFFFSQFSPLFLRGKSEEKNLLSLCSSDRGRHSIYTCGKRIKAFRLTKAAAAFLLASFLSSLPSASISGNGQHESVTKRSAAPHVLWLSTYILCTSRYDTRVWYE